MRDWQEEYTKAQEEIKRLREQIVSLQIAAAPRASEVTKRVYGDVTYESKG